MKTLILTGSPRKNGHSMRMAEYLAEYLEGEMEYLSLDNRKDIMPCRDCRYCYTHPECAIHDGMEEIYAGLEAADRMVFAAPVYFYNIPGSMKAVLDRLQVYWTGVLRGDKKPLTKKGAILLAGGAPESPRQFRGAIQTLQYMIDDLGAECVGEACMGGTDKRGLDERSDVQERLRQIAQELSLSFCS